MASPRIFFLAFEMHIPVLQEKGDVPEFI